jgi:hypothetical protein
MQIAEEYSDAFLVPLEKALDLQASETLAIPQMGPEDKPVKPTLSVAKRKEAKAKQIAGIDAFLQGVPELLSHSDKLLSRAESLQRAFAISQRLERLRDIGLKSNLQVLDSDSTNWRIQTRSDAKDGRIAMIVIVGTGGKRNGTTVFLDIPPYENFPVVATDFLSPQLQMPPFDDSDTENAMLIAEGIFNAIVNPWEEAYGLPPLPDVSGNPKLREILSAMGYNEPPPVEIAEY